MPRNPSNLFPHRRTCFHIGVRKFVHLKSGSVKMLHEETPTKTFQAIDVAGPASENGPPRYVVCGVWVEVPVCSRALDFC